MKTTPLLEEHQKSNAKLVEFAGWQMPVQYEGILQEHQSVRTKAGIFDVSHMGEFFVSGKDSTVFLNSLIPQEIENLYAGKAIYCQLTNENAGIIDDLLIYRLENNEYLLIVNASRLDVDLDWLNAHKKAFDVKIENKSDYYALIAIQGPNAVKIMDKSEFTDHPPFMHIAKCNLLGKKVYVSRTGYTGEDGFEILVKNEDAPTIWQRLLENGQEFGIKPIGLGARDTLRLEAALLLYGNDMNDSTTPLEAGLKWSIAKNKKSDYIGKEKIQTQLKDGIDKKLIGFKLLDKGIAREGATILRNEKVLGKVTSGGFSPIDKKGFGLGYINDTNLKLDDKIEIEVRGRKIPAIIAKRPFVNKSYVK